MDKADKMRLELKRYLGQYYRAKQKRKQLERRLQAFREEMGVKGMRYSGVMGSTNKVSSAVEEQVVRAMEIEERIRKQQAEVQRAMIDIMDAVDCLPVESIERLILEYRYIDCLSWKEICTVVGMSRTSCNKYHDGAIDKLLIKQKDCC